MLTAAGNCQFTLPTKLPHEFQLSVSPLLSHLVSFLSSLIYNLDLVITIQFVSNDIFVSQISNENMIVGL